MQSYMHILYWLFFGVLSLLALFVTGITAYVPVCKMKTPWWLKVGICLLELAEGLFFVLLLGSAAHAPLFAREVAGIGFWAELGVYAVSLVAVLSVIYRTLNATDRWLRPIESRYI